MSWPGQWRPNVVVPTPRRLRPTSRSSVPNRHRERRCLAPNGCCRTSGAAGNCCRSPCKRSPTTPPRSRSSPWPSGPLLVPGWSIPPSATRCGGPPRRPAKTRRSASGRMRRSRAAMSDRRGPRSRRGASASARFRSAPTTPRCCRWPGTTRRRPSNGWRCSPSRPAIAMARWCCSVRHRQRNAAWCARRSCARVTSRRADCSPCCKSAGVTSRPASGRCAPCSRRTGRRASPC